MSEKPEVSQGMRTAGAIGGVVVGALVGAIAMAVATMLSEMLGYAFSIPTPFDGGVAGSCIGLALGICFPEKLARALGGLISSL